jgi:hypothetical protein
MEANMVSVTDLKHIETARGEVAAIPEHLYGLGMRHSIGGLERFDLITAHMYFNLAGIKGHRHAKARRAEIATEMSAAEIAAAQRAARIWLDEH